MRSSLFAGTALGNLRFSNLASLLGVECGAFGRDLGCGCDHCRSTGRDQGPRQRNIGLAIVEIAYPIFQIVPKRLQIGLVPAGVAHMRREANQNAELPAEMVWRSQQRGADAMIAF